MLDKLTSADFSAYLNTMFRIRAAATLEPLEAELIEVSELGAEPQPDQERAQRRPFSIVFRAPADSVLAQRIYPVEHAELGTLQLFLVPLGPDRLGMRFEAVFT